VYFLNAPPLFLVTQAIPEREPATTYDDFVVDPPFSSQAGQSTPQMSALSCLPSRAKPVRRRHARRSSYYPFG